MAKKAKIESHLPEVESSIERWLRENVPRMRYALVSKVQLLELEEKIKNINSEEEKARLCKEFIEVLFKGN